MRANPLMRVAIRLTGAAIVVAGFLQLSNAHAHTPDHTSIEATIVVTVAVAPASSALTGRTS